MKNRRKVKILIFDLGNVVLKFSHRKAVRKIAGLSGLPERLIYKSIFSSGIERLFDSGRISAKEFYEKISAKSVKSLAYKDFRQAWADIFKPVPAMDNFLRKLSRKYTLCLLSNTNAIHFPFVKKNFPITGIFDRYFLSYKLGFCKPDKRIFREVLKRYNLKAGECVYIDDINEYAAAAKKLGFNAVRHKNIKSLEASLKKLGVEA